MKKLLVGLLCSGLLLVAVLSYELQRSRTWAASQGECEQPEHGPGPHVVVGPQPLRVIVTHIDYDHRTVDFKTEIGTFLHVTQGTAATLGALQVGDVVTLCIAEELQGEREA
ncbi:MAG: hypothetical protein AB7G75_34985 [Candidatus Binatia bacterium]